MPKMLSHYTELARRRPSDAHHYATPPGEITAAVPARTPDPVEHSFAASAGAAGGLAGLLGLLIAGSGILLMTFRRLANNRNEEVPTSNAFVIFRETGVELARVKRFGRPVGPTLAAYPLDQVSYHRTDFAVDTRMMIAGREWMIHGWFERDLRAALGPLGVPLDPLAAPIPYKEIDQ